MTAREKHFLFDPTKTPLEERQEDLKTRGITFHPSNHMAYHPPSVPADWPIQGFRLVGFDITFEPPRLDRMFKQIELGRLDLAAQSEAKNYIASLKLYNALKSKFGVPKKRLDELLGVEF